MLKRNLLNISLLIFIIVLVLLVVYQPGKEEAKTIPELTSLKLNDIHTIKIIRAKATEKTLEFRKMNNSWVMLKPYKLPANKFRIESILKILSTQSLSQNNLAGLNRKTFGLANPVATIILNNNTTIKFGHNKSLKNYRYVELNSILHMIIDTYYYQLTAKPESYISHKLIPENSKIIKLILPNMVLENTTGKWKLTPPPQSGSADSITQLMNEWEYSQAYDISMANIKNKLQPDVTVMLSNNKTIHFKIESAKTKFNLINTDTHVRYILAADRKNKLLKLLGINQSNE